MRAGLCGQDLLPDGFPDSGQQLVYTGVRQIGDAGEDIGEPRLRVDVVELSGDDEGVHRRGVPPRGRSRRTATTVFPERLRATHARRRSLSGRCGHRQGNGRKRTRQKPCVGASSASTVP